MLTIGIRFLTGYAGLQAWGDDGPEWPPHPGRLFMAMAAGLFQTEPLPGEDRTDWEAERDALAWLSELPAPHLSCPPACRRSEVSAFVPANDQAAMKSKALLQCLPSVARHRAERSFPRVWIQSDETGEPSLVYLCWPQVDVEAYGNALDRLCRKVTRLGHPATLVQAWVEDRAPASPPTLVPCDAGEHVLRVFRGGLEAIERLRWPVDDETGIPQPPAGRKPLVATQRYAAARAVAPGEAHGSVFRPALQVLRLSPGEGAAARLDLVTTLRLTEVLRKAVLDQASRRTDAVPELLHGHSDGGGPTQSPHLAFVPLASVGHPHSDGHLMAVAAALPRDAGDEDRIAAMTALGEVARQGLTLGELGRWQLEDIGLGEAEPMTVRSATWTAWPRGARVWATVTPISFDRHSKAKDRATYEKEVAEDVAAACERLGLPRPAAVFATGVSRFQGTPASWEFPRLRRKDGSQRRHRHAVIEFAEPVVGPILLGAGRFRGYGFCRPVWEQST